MLLGASNRTAGNFSKVARVVDEHGTVVILKNNVSRDLVIDFIKAEKEKITSNEDAFSISERLISQGLIPRSLLRKKLFCKVKR